VFLLSAPTSSPDTKAHATKKIDFLFRMLDVQRFFLAMSMASLVSSQGALGAFLVCRLLFLA
tara:strand:+ start:533 stop:718 length:186 start_codon:yes stop_codon:yes gene_type:complete